MTLLESPDRDKDIPQQKPTRVSFLIFLQFWKKEEEKEVRNYLSKTATFKETGNWSGMISNLVNGEADLITTSMTLCCSRENAVDYLWTLSTSTSGMAIKG